MSANQGTKRADGLTIVVPVYNEAPGLAKLHAKLTSLAGRLRDQRGLKIEIVYVDSNSSAVTRVGALEPRYLPLSAIPIQYTCKKRTRRSTTEKHDFFLSILIDICLQSFYRVMLQAGCCMIYITPSQACHYIK